MGIYAYVYNTPALSLVKIIKIFTSLDKNSLILLICGHDKEKWMIFILVIIKYI